MTKTLKLFHWTVALIWIIVIIYGEKVKQPPLDYNIAPIDEAKESLVQEVTRQILIPVFYPRGNDDDLFKNKMARRSKYFFMGNSLSGRAHIPKEFYNSVERRPELTPQRQQDQYTPDHIRFQPFRSAQTEPHQPVVMGIDFEKKNPHVYNPLYKEEPLDIAVLYPNTDTDYFPPPSNLTLSSIIPAPQMNYTFPSAAVRFPYSPYPGNYFPPYPSYSRTLHGLSEAPRQQNYGKQFLLPILLTLRPDIKTLFSMSNVTERRVPLHIPSSFNSHNDFLQTHVGYNLQPQHPSTIKKPFPLPTFDKYPQFRNLNIISQSLPQEYPHGYFPFYGKPFQTSSNVARTFPLSVNPQSINNIPSNANSSLIQYNTPHMYIDPTSIYSDRKLLQQGNSYQTLFKPNDPLFSRVFLPYVYQPFSHPPIHTKFGQTGNIGENHFKQVTLVDQGTIKNVQNLPQTSSPDIPEKHSDTHSVMNTPITLHNFTFPDTSDNTDTITKLEVVSQNNPGKEKKEQTELYSEEIIISNIAMETEKGNNFPNDLESFIDVHKEMSTKNKSVIITSHFVTTTESTNVGIIKQEEVITTSATNTETGNNIFRESILTATTPTSTNLETVEQKEKITSTVTSEGTTETISIGTTSDFTSAELEEQENIATLDATSEKKPEIISIETTIADTITVSTKTEAVEPQNMSTIAAASKETTQNISKNITTAVTTNTFRDAEIIKQQEMSTPAVANEETTETLSEDTTDAVTTLASTKTKVIEQQKISTLASVSKERAEAISKDTPADIMPLAFTKAEIIEEQEISTPAAANVDATTTVSKGTPADVTTIASIKLDTIKQQEISTPAVVIKEITENISSDIIVDVTTFGSTETETIEQQEILTSAAANKETRETISKDTTADVTTIALATTQITKQQEITTPAPASEETRDTVFKNTTADVTTIALATTQITKQQEITTPAPASEETRDTVFKDTTADVTTFSSTKAEIIEQQEITTPATTSKETTETTSKDTTANVTIFSSTKAEIIEQQEVTTPAVGDEEIIGTISIGDITSYGNSTSISVVISYEQVNFEENPSDSRLNKLTEKISDKQNHFSENFTGNNNTTIDERNITHVRSFWSIYSTVGINTKSSEKSGNQDYLVPDEPASYNGTNVVILDQQPATDPLVIQNVTLRELTGDYKITTKEQELSQDASVNVNNDDIYDKSLEHLGSSSIFEKENNESTKEPEKDILEARDPVTNNVFPDIYVQETEGVGKLPTFAPMIVASQETTTVKDGAKLPSPFLVSLERTETNHPTRNEQGLALHSNEKKETVNKNMDRLMFGFIFKDKRSVYHP